MDGGGCHQARGGRPKRRAVVKSSGSGAKPITSDIAHKIKSSSIDTEALTQKDANPGHFQTLYRQCLYIFGTLCRLTTTLSRALSGQFSAPENSRAAKICVRAPPASLCIGGILCSRPRPERSFSRHSRDGFRQMYEVDVVVLTIWCDHYLLENLKPIGGCETGCCAACSAAFVV